MEKQIRITIPERKARMLRDSLHSQMHYLDELYKAGGIPNTKASADVIEEIYENLRVQIFD